MPVKANVYHIDFVYFRIRDADTDTTLFEIAKPDEPVSADYSPENDDGEWRLVQYNFDRSFLDLAAVGTTLHFRVGDAPVPNFRMIERHYFKGKLVKSYDFSTGFCIPNTENSWETIYTLPELTSAQKDEMIAAPFESRSDSFYFVNDVLVMHHMAEFAYN